VRLVWASRSLAELGLFAATLRAAAQHMDATAAQPAAQVVLSLPEGLSALIHTESFHGGLYGGAVIIRYFPPQPRVSFESHLYVTAKEQAQAPARAGGADLGGAAAWLRANATLGQRPDLAALLSDLLPPPLAAEGARGGGGGGAGATATLFVCGPAPLTSAASELAYRCGATFHSEVFHF
jgi:hypothetical protein